MLNLYLVSFQDPKHSCYVIAESVDEAYEFIEKRSLNKMIISIKLIATQKHISPSYSIVFPLLFAKENKPKQKTIKMEDVRKIQVFNKENDEVVLNIEYNKKEDGKAILNVRYNETDNE